MSKHEAMQKNCPTSSIYGRAGDHPSASHMPPAAAMNGFQPAGDPDSGLSPLRTPARQTRVESRELSMADRATDPSPPRTVSPCCPHPPGFTPLRHLATEPGPRAPLSPRPLLLPLASPAGEEASPGGGAGARARGAPFAPDTHPALPWEAARAPAAPRDAGSSPAEAAPWRRAAPHPGAAPSSAHAPNRAAAAAASGARSRVAAAAAGQGPGRERRRPPRPGSPRPRLAQRGAGPRSPVPARGREAGRPPAKASLRRRFSPSSAAPPVGPALVRPSGERGPGPGTAEGAQAGGQQRP